SLISLLTSSLALFFTLPLILLYINQGIAVIMILENEIIFNGNNTVSVPFGHIAESYILHHPFLKNTHLKSQSHLQTPQLIKEGLITLCHVEDVADFLE
ncbi:3250_t:CDS:1, partial [Cetraspora pellucida]